MPTPDPLGWDLVPDDYLFTITSLKGTPLRAMSTRTVYALIANGQLRAVSIGARRYLTKRAIVEFIRARERVVNS